MREAEKCAEKIAEREANRETEKRATALGKVNVSWKERITRKH